MACDEFHTPCLLLRAKKDLLEKRGDREKKDNKERKECRELVRHR